MAAPMLSALVTAFRAPENTRFAEGVVRTLAALVPAAVENLVRDVTLLGPADLQELRDIADHAGCAFLPAASEKEALSAGLKSVRCETILILRAGYAPKQGFLEEMSELFPYGRQKLEKTAVLREERVGLQKVFGARGRVAALLAPLSALSGREAVSLDELAKRIGPDVSFGCGVLKIG